jgi:predicted nucleotidyltransferase
MKAGHRLNLREIARALKVSPTAVSNALKLLEKQEIIKIKRSQPFNLFSIELNRDNPKVIQLKRVENLRQIYESGLHNFLFNEFPGCTIVLFGSYSLGEDTWFGLPTESRSDIDIAIIGSDRKEINLSNFEKILLREININFYKTWKDMHIYLKSNLLGGILLSGSFDLWSRQKPSKNM